MQFYKIINTKTNVCMTFMPQTKTSAISYMNRLTKVENKRQLQPVVQLR